MLPPSVFTSLIISSLSCVSIFIGFFHMLKCLSHHFFLSLSLPSTKAKEASKQTKHLSTDTWSSFSYHPKEKICFLSLFPHLFTPGSIQLGFDYLPYTESFFFHQVYLLIFKSSENFLVFLLPNTLGYSTLTPHIFNPKSTVLWCIYWFLLWALFSLPLFSMYCFSLSLASFLFKELIFFGQFHPCSRLYLPHICW